MTKRWLGRIGALLVTGMAATTPASAQFWWKGPDLSGPAANGAEPELGYALPDATQAEQRAAMLWNLRTGLNVAALQCQFEPTLLTLNQYNNLLNHHRVELAAAYTTLENYFKRLDRRQGPRNFDRFGDRTYNGFSTVRGQLNFCSTSSQVGEQAIFAPRGELWRVAQNRLLEMRRSLQPASEQQFRFRAPPQVTQLAYLSPDCYDRRDRLRRQCGGTAR